MRAVTGWPDARDGKLLSIFEAMKRGLIADTRVIRLLEAQIATGGIIDPRQHHRVPINISDVDYSIRNSMTNSRILPMTLKESFKIILRNRY